MKNLIITADDFGAAVEVNHAVEQAHRHGVLTAASLMVSGAAAADAVKLARAMPNLKVGLHLVLVDGRPILPSRQVSELVDRDGFFRNDMARAGWRMFVRRKAKEQLAAEIEAQFEAFAATRLALDHVNAHKHFHLHPTIGELMLKFAKAYGAKGARVPLEPQKILRRIEPVRLSASLSLTGGFARRLRRHFVKENILAPDFVFGLAWSGKMSAERLKGLVKELPEGLSEIYLHPATGPYPGSAEGYAYREELNALTDPAIPALVAQGNIRLGGFGDFWVE